MDTDIYDPSLTYANITLLVEFLAVRARAGDWSTLPAAFHALEAMLVSADDALESLLTAGFLEELHSDFEEFDPALERLRGFVQGPRTAAAWKCAWDYRHPADRSGARSVT